MLKTIKDFFSNLFSTSVEVDKPFVYPKYDSNKLKRELSVEKKGKEDGLANIPPHTSKEVIGYEKTITNNLITKVTEVEANTRGEIQTLVEDISHLEIDNLRKKIEDYNDETKDEFAKLRNEEGNFKYYESQEVQNINKIFKEFQDNNNLTRAPRYPDSKRLSYAIIFALIVLEIFLNSVFFKEFTTSGILGGVFVALSIAGLNVGLGYLYGEHVSRFINHVSSFKKFLAYSLGLVFIISITLVNFFAAHLRDVIDTAIKLGEMANSVEMMTVAKQLINTPFALNSFESILLIIIGMFFSITAMVKMYFADDPYPGYGELDREKKIKTHEHYSEIQEYIESCRSKMKERALDIRNTITGISTHLNLLTNYKGRLTLYTTNFKTYLNQVQTIADEIVNEYRSTNMRNRPEPKKFPKYYDKPFIMAYQPLIEFPETKIEELLTNLEKIKDNSEKLTYERVAVIHKEYKKALNEFKDIKELDIQSYLDEINE